MIHPTLFDLVCKGCGGTTFLETLEPPNSTHHARRNCESCGRFHSWVRKPQQEISLSRLLQNPHLHSWEKGFAKMLSLKGVWTQAEKNMLKQISDRVNSL